MKKTKVLAVICAISMFVGGCQSDPKKQIIGTWEFDEGFTITFMDDGTFLDDDGRIITGVYSFADDKICLTLQMVSGIRSTNTAMYTYEINGDELTLEDDDQEMVGTKE